MPKIIIKQTALPSPTFYDGALPLRTGQTTSYFSNDDGETERGRGADFFNLNYDNPFGHIKRFSGTTGGYQSEIDNLYYDVDGVATTEALAFPDDWVIDWNSFQIATETYAMYQRTPRVASADYTAVMLEQPITIGGYADVYYCNIDELLQISQKYHFTGLQLAYVPFSYTITGTNTTRIGSTTNNGTNKHCLNQTGNVASLSVGTSTVFWYVRYGTLTELGL
jgi:hypothetical protein